MKTNSKESQLIEQANIIHNNKYDYSLFKYINNNTKMKIICTVHGLFEQLISNHISGKNGCPLCSGKKRKTDTEFINEANKVHDNKYDYSLIKYINNVTKVDIICKKHGIFQQTPKSHLNSNGCPSCSNNKKLTTNDFIERANEIHNNKYDYSLVNYTTNHNKINIICKEHGIFEQSASSHLNGNCCNKCARNKIKNNTKNRTIKFIKKANKIHDNKYDYSLVEYIDCRTKIKIICKEHGVFEQIPINHLRNGCLRCSGYNKKTIDEFINEANEIHNNKYDYSIISYNNTAKKINIICKEHGIFQQTPGHHLFGQGCPSCNESRGEKMIIEYLKLNNIEFERQKRFDGCKNKNRLPFDFYLLKYNLCIEYDGIQHFQVVENWGSINGLHERQLKDKIKTDFCNSNHINLLRIPYTEIQNINKILNEYLT